MNTHHHNSDSHQQPSMDLQLDKGLSNRLTLVVGTHTAEPRKAVRDWVGSRSITAVFMPNPDEEEDELTCPKKLRDAFVEAGLIDSKLVSEPNGDCQVILVDLINRLSRLDGDIALVFEDYAPSKTVDALLTFILEYLPNQLHLYVCCDTPPSLNCIPRLRVRRQLQTIVTNDL